MSALDDPVIIIFGACHPLGRAASASFAGQGARVVVIDEDRKALQRVCAANPERIEALSITDMQGRLAQMLQEEWGAQRIDMVINLLPLSGPEDISHQIRNLKNVLQVALRGMVQAKGSMVTVMHAPGDLMALERQAMRGAIAAAHAALARQLAPKGLQIHGLSVRPKDTASALEALLFLASPQGGKLRSTQLDLDVLLPG